MKDSDHVIQAINNAATTKANNLGPALANGSIAGGSAAAANNPQILGNYLATHFLGALSYSEVIAIIGATWVMIQILKTIVPLIIEIVRNIMPKKPTQPTIQTTSAPKVKKPVKTPKDPA